MIINVLNRELKSIDIIDDAQSVIWTKRFWECGDFELYMIANEKNLKKIQQGYFLSRDDDDTVMVIENITITTDVENGNFLTVSGRSMESLIDRRCVWDVSNGNGWWGGLGSPVQTVFNLVMEHFNDNGSKEYRKMPLELLNRYSNTLIPFRVPGEGMRWNTEFIYGTLLEVLMDECKAVGIGFKLSIWSADAKLIDFDAIIGTDRSVSQTANPHIIFSGEYDNLIKSNYSKQTSKYRNSAIVFGEGEGVDRKNAIVVLNNASGLDLYEMPVDARDISSSVDTDTTLSTADYMELLRQRGLNKLSEHTIKESFEGDIQEGIQWNYKKDYFIGDIVTMQNEYGIQQNVRITAVTECEDNTGYYYIPIFENVEV